MKYNYQNADSRLAEYVRTKLVVEGSKRDVEANVPLFTNGMPALLCHSRVEKGMERVVELALYGRSTPADKWMVKEGETIVAYFFKPFSLAPMFNLSVDELKSDPVALQSWDAHKANALIVQLAVARTTNQKIAVLDNLLFVQHQQQGSACELIRKATEGMMTDTGTNTLSLLRKELRINERTFQRLFKKYVGVAPNQFRRICQFQLSFTKVRGGHFDHLTDVAFDSGFADQSHFIRTFKEFTKTKPKEYLKKGLRRK